MKKLTLVTAGLLAAMIAAVPAFAADPVAECIIPEKAAAIDGVISAGEWDQATKLVLNISDTSAWTEDGAGIVGTDGWSALGHTDADFYNELAFMADETYIYILCTRTDSTLNFATDNFHTPYASDCSLMWFYDTEEFGQYGLQLLCADKSGVPHIGYFFTDAEQQNSVDLIEEGLAEAKTVITDNGYVMEAKVAYEGMDDLTLEMLKSGSVTVTYCSVNICEEGWDSDDGAHALWGTYNYQAQYAGVNYWDFAPKAVITEAAAPVVEEPAEEPAATVEEPVAEPVAEAVEAPAEETPTAEEAVEEEIVEVPAVEEIAETPVIEEAAEVTEAPQTFDFGMIAAVSALISLAGFAVTKKR